MRRAAAPIILGAILILSQGCSSAPRQMIEPDHLWLLGGFHEGDSVPLSTLEGETVRFTSETPLYLWVEGGPNVAAYLARVDVDVDDVLRATTTDGRSVEVAIADVRAAAIVAWTEQEIFQARLDARLGRPRRQTPGEMTGSAAGEVVGHFLAGAVLAIF